MKFMLQVMNEGCVMDEESSSVIHERALSMMVVEAIT